MATLRAQVGALVRHHRERAGLTQTELAERSGRSLETVGKVERGAATPSFDTLTDLSNALGVPVREFFGAGSYEAAAGRSDPLVRLIDRVAGLGDDEMERLDRIVAAVLAWKARP